MKDVIELGVGNELVSDALLNRLNIPKKSRENGRSLAKLGKSILWSNLFLEGQYYYFVDTLSPKIRKIVGDLNQYRNSGEEETIREITQANTDIQLVLDLTYYNKRFWKQYLPLYKDRYFIAEDQIKYAKCHSVIVAMKGLILDGYLIRDVYEAFSIYRKRVRLYNFKVSSYKYFCRKLSFLNEVDIHIGLIHGNKGIPRQDLIFTKYHKKLAIKFYSKPHPNFMTYQEITDAVNNEVVKRGLEEISLSTIKHFLSNPEIQNLYKPFRLGREWAKTYLIPYLPRAPLKAIHDKWEIDGLCIPFYVLVDSKGTIARMWMVIVVDVYSRKIIGYSVGRHETACLVMKTYFDAISKTYCVAIEIVHDNSKAFQSKQVTLMEEKLENDFGSFVRLAEPENAKDKGTVEAVVKILKRKFFSKFEGYLGSSPRAVTEEHRLEKKARKEYYKKHHARRPEDIVAMCDQVIKQYNETAF